MSRQFKPAPLPKSEASSMPLGQLIAKHGVKRVALMAGGLLALAGVAVALMVLYDDFVHGRYAKDSLMPALWTSGILIVLGIVKAVIDPEQEITLEDAGLFVNGKYIPREALVSAYALPKPARLVLRYADKTLEVPLERYSEADRAAIPEAIEAWRKP